MKRALVGLLVVAMGAVSGSRAYGQQLPIANLDTADGLGDNWVSRIVKDSRGWLWFCTQDGLSRFDGYSVTTFGKGQGLPDARVTDLLETASGEYWLATGAGVVRFNPKGAPMFAQVPWPDGPVRPSSAFVLREERNGAIWVGTDQGLFLLRLTSGRAAWSSINVGLPDSSDARGVSAVLQDRRGDVWVGSSSGLYRGWPDGTFARYTTADGLPGDSISDIFQSRLGDIWIGTRWSGVFRVTPGESRQAPTVDRLFAIPRVPSNGIYQLTETRDGRFWVATAGGLVMFESEAATSSGHFEVYDRRNGLRDQNVLALAEDLAGNLWMGTWHSGAIKLVAGGLTMFGERDGIASIQALFEDATGRLCYRGWFIGDDHATRTQFARLGCFDGRTFAGFWPDAIHGSARNSSHDRVTLQAHRGDWWVGAANGLYHFPAARRLEALRSAIPLAVYSRGSDRFVYRLFEDSAGLLWVSTRGQFNPSPGGLARWSPDPGVLQDLAGSPGLPDVSAAYANAFAEDAAGDVWIGFSGVLARYRHGTFRTFGAADGVPAGAVNALYRDVTGTMWFASGQSGLVRITAPESEHPGFSVFGTAQGLSSNLLTVVDDLEGRIYTGGFRGLDRFDPQTGHVTHLTSDGLAPFWLFCSFRDRLGVLWFGTSRGLLRLAPLASSLRNASDHAAAPAVYLTALEIDGVSKPLSPIGETDMTVPTLDPGSRAIKFSFGGFQFSSGEALRYQFRVGGKSAEWSTPTTDRSITYANLSGGHYEFMVRAVAPDGAVSATPARVSFSILRPLWQRPWFVALAIAVIGLATVAAYRIRVARLLQVANMRTLIASDLHDDIGANLTRIALLSDAVPATTNGMDAAIGRIARESVSAMSDIVWAIKPERESPVDLARRMRQQSDDLFGAGDTTLRFNAPPAGAEIKLDIDVRRDVLLFFKEAVTNVARHSNCSGVAIDFIVDRHRLSLSIADDGVGFDPSVERDGQGLRSLRRRAARLGADVTINSSPGQGTVVSLSVPL